ncbi:uncharacterized protein LOC116415812 isoform X2 [Nasonia vitripennis]|uniref:Uncharacterized protein n=1 Tax=Nasonia vitripennis TaxID=7425 RepID=A0A7M7T670_NASVI|nr:uncharacterized protein LOC116415812 isoform X2 [Nasonia vitripennis]
MLESSGEGDADFTPSSPIGPPQACSTPRADNENDESCSEEDFFSSPDVEAFNRAFIGRSYPRSDLVRVIHRNYAVPNEAVQCAIDARSVSESSDEDDEPANSTATAAAVSTNNAQRAAIQNFYSRPVPEAERSYHQIVDRARMTYHRYDERDAFDNRINEQKL